MIIRTIEALFTLKSNAADFRKATSEVDRFAQNASNVLGAIAGHFAFQAISGFVTESAKAMSEVGKRAGLLGLASEELQEMRYAAQKSGVAIDTLDDSLKELQIRAVDSLSGSGEAFDAFKKLKVNPKDMFGRMREPLELLDEVADKLNRLPTQSERIWVVDSMFGDQGAEMLKMLKDGSAGLREMRAEARSLGGILSAETIANSEKFNAALNRLKTSLQGTGQSVVGDLLPGLTGFSEHLARLNSGLNQIKVPIEIHRTALLSLAAALTMVAIKAAIAFLPLLAAMLPVIILTAKITALAFLVTDLWAAFQGGDSVLASLQQKLDTFFAPVDKWLVEIPGKVQAVFAGLANKIPGLKDDFSANIKSASKVYHHLEPMNTRMAPQPSNFSNHNLLTSNQSVNVAVNVKSGANPQEIGSEVSKVVRKELERERFNAFMGVSQYAG